MKSTKATFMCWLPSLIGVFGIHKFYLGKTFGGVARILCSLLTLYGGSGFWVILYFWAAIDLLRLRRDVRDWATSYYVEYFKAGNGHKVLDDICELISKEAKIGKKSGEIDTLITTQLESQDLDLITRQILLENQRVWETQALLESYTIDSYDSDMQEILDQSKEELLKNRLVEILNGVTKEDLERIDLNLALRWQTLRREIDRICSDRIIDEIEEQEINTLTSSLRISLDIEIFKDELAKGSPELGQTLTRLISVDDLFYSDDDEDDEDDEDENRISLLEEKIFWEYLDRISAINKCRKYTQIMRGKIPVITNHSLNLGSGDSLFYIDENCKIKQMRTTGEGRGRNRVEHTVLDTLDEGTVYISKEDIKFFGDQRTINLDNEKYIKVEPYQDAVSFHPKSGKPFFVMPSDPFEFYLIFLAQNVRMDSNTGMESEESFDFFYELLGLSSGATSDEIKQAYREKAKLAHPDRGGDPSHFSVLTKAKNVLLSRVA